MTITIMSPDFTLLGEIGKFTALTWTERAPGIGSFTLWCPLVKENVSLLVKDNLVWTGEDTIGVVEIIRQNITETGKTLQIEGQFIECWLGRRTIWDKLVKTGKVSSVQRHLVDTQCINPTVAVRKLPLISLDPDQVEVGEEISYSKSEGNVLEEVSSISAAYLVYFRLRADVRNKSLKFSLHKGVDRSREQTEVPVVNLSTELSDLLSSEYMKDVSASGTTALVAGAGEDMARKTLVVNGELSGLERREVYVDARDLSDTDENEMAIPPETYNAMLKERGLSKLAEVAPVEEFSAVIRPNGSAYVYGVDYFLGDKITLEDQELGLVISPYITEVERAWDESGFQMTLTFGKAAPTITQALKRRN